MENKDLQRVSPEVLTRSAPQAEDLLQARADVQSNPHIKDLFKRSKEENWDREGTIDKVATAMAKIWPFGDPTEAVSYLVDEFNQLEPGIYLTDRKTGKVIAILQEDDIYQPAMVPREGGGMAKPLRRIKPELEAAIYLHLHDTDRESEILATLTSKVVQTDLVKDNGDFRLLVATRNGRKHVVASLSQQPPKDLLEAAGGATGIFLSKFELEHSDRQDLETLTGRAKAKSSLKIQDQTTLNTQFHQIGGIQASLTNSWIRDMARELSLHVHSKQEVRPFQLEGRPNLGDFLIVPPELVRVVKKLSPKTCVLPVEGAKPISLQGSLGYLSVPEAFLARNFDAFDRWEVYADLEFTLKYDARLAFPFILLGVEPEVQVL